MCSKGPKGGEGVQDRPLHGANGTSQLDDSGEPNLNRRERWDKHTVSRDLVHRPFYGAEGEEVGPIMPLWSGLSTTELLLAMKM